MNSFGVRNELKSQRQREKETERMDTAIAIVCLIVLAAYALAAYLEQPGAFK